MYNKPIFLTVLSLSIMACGEEAPKPPQPVEKKVEVPTHKPIALSPKMLTITGSQFSMGSAKGQRDENVHIVDLSGHEYLVSEAEVTQELYELVMTKNPSKFKSPLNPVERVSWRDALDFCNRLSEMENLTPVYTFNENQILWNGKADGYRLLTEAEWEFAARGGVDSLYSGSDNNDEVAWTSENSKKKTNLVKQKSPNAFGLYDMSGNVYEWVWDWHPCGTLSFDTLKKCDGEYDTATVKLPTGPTKGAEKVFRGGSYKQKKTSSRVTNRGFYVTNTKQTNVGFRIARNKTNGYAEEIVSIQMPAEPSKASLTKEFNRLKYDYSDYAEPTLTEYLSEVLICQKDFPLKTPSCMAHCALMKMDRYAYNFDHDIPSNPSEAARGVLEDKECIPKTRTRRQVAGWTEDLRFSGRITEAPSNKTCTPSTVNVSMIEQSGETLKQVKVKRPNGSEVVVTDEPCGDYVCSGPEYGDVRVNSCTVLLDYTGFSDCTMVNYSGVELIDGNTGSSKYISLIKGIEGISPDGKFGISDNTTSLGVWDLETGEEVQTFDTPRDVECTGIRWNSNTEFDAFCFPWEDPYGDL